MPFCPNCGQQLAEGTKFCPECGKPVSASRTTDAPQRKQVFEGEIRKCPNCGEVLKSFEAACPACGHELRGVKATSSVQALAKEIAAIEAGRPTATIKSFRETLLSDPSVVDETDSRIASAIQNFPVPNTKEDILEFLILASSNIDTDALDKSNSSTYSVISAAWAAKYEQTYQKAKILFGDDPNFQKLRKTYYNRKKEIEKAQNQSVRYGIISVLVMAVIIAMMLMIIGAVQRGVNTQEDERLDSVIEQIQVDLQNGEYRLAMMNALSIEYAGNNKEQERKWSIQQTYWIGKILDEASQNGIDLKYMIPQELDLSESPREVKSTEETEAGGFFDELIQGFRDAFK